MPPYNRPDYLKPTLDSLESNPESQYLPFHFFIDGNPKSDPKIQEVYDIIKKSRIKDKRIVIRNERLGPCPNIVKSWIEMFDVYNYERIIFFEDDMIMSPNYINLTLNLHNWANKYYNNIGYVMCHSICHWSKEEKEKNLTKVAPSFGHMVGFCLSKQVWNDIKSTMYEYEEKFLRDGIASHIVHLNAIRQFIKSILNQKTKKKGNVVDIGFIPKIFLDYENFATSQDFVINSTLFAKGYINLATLVNHALYIGHTGFHFYKEIWEKFGYNTMNLDTFPNNIKEFEPTYAIPKDTQL